MRRITRWLRRFPWPPDAWGDGSYLGVVLASDRGRRVFLWGVNHGLKLPSPLAHLLVHAYNRLYCLRHGHDELGLELVRAGLVPLGEARCVSCMARLEEK